METVLEYSAVLFLERWLIIIHNVGECRNEVDFIELFINNSGMSFTFVFIHFIVTTLAGNIEIIIE